MSAADRLNEIEARANAIFDPPWRVKRAGDGVLDRNDLSVARGMILEDAEFTAHAQADVPALVAALRAVLDLHVATEGYLHDGAVCLECTTFGDVEVPLPCATVRAIEEALNG